MDGLPKKKKKNELCYINTKYELNHLSFEWILPKLSKNHIIFSFKNWGAWAQINVAYDQFV